MNLKRMQNKVTFWACFGSLIEYFDFVIYAMMAKYLGPLFFGTNDPYLALIQSFLLFAVGYFMRPVGGIIAGIIGDKYGRKPAFLLLTSLMALTTLSIGILPVYENVGLVAPLLLALLRSLQGLSFGGELPGATTLVGEFTPHQKQGWRSSLIIASTSIGALLATFALFLMTSFLKEQEILAYGWRIPFLLGGSFGVLLFIARWKLEETPVFKNEVKPAPHLKPFSFLLKTYPPLVLRGLFLTTFFASLIIVNLYFPFYLPTSFGFETKDVYFAITLSLIFSVLILPFSGTLADKYLKQKLLIKTCFAYLILSPFLYSLLTIQSKFSLIFFLMCHQLFIALFAVGYFPLLLNLFPPRVRYTGIALCYNGMFALMALLPTLLTMLLETFKTWWVTPICLSLTASLSLVAAVKIKVKKP